MPIFTLTTDLGDKDHYVAAVKGQILKEVPDARIIDISNKIEPFNIIAAAFILKNCYKDFPEGTFHLVGVDSLGSPEISFLVVLKDNHYFFGADNGIFSLMFSGEYDKIIELKVEEDNTYTSPVKEVYAKAACYLAKGGDMDQLGAEKKGIDERMVLQPILRENFVQGSVIHIDAYQNIITNISKEFFEKVGQGRPFRIYYMRRDYLDVISRNYNEVPEGEILCLFGKNGLLEIAINKDKAKDLLGLDIGHSIQIEFYDYSHS